MPQTDFWSSPSAMHIGTLSPELELYLLMSPGSVSTALISCLWDAKIHWHEETIGHDHYSSMGWPRTHQQISNETSADGSGMVVGCQNCGSFYDDQGLVWGIYLDVLSDIQLLPNVFWTMRTETHRPIRLISFTMIPHTERNMSPSCYGEGHGLRVRWRYAYNDSSQVNVININATLLWGKLRKSANWDWAKAIVNHKTQEGGERSFVYCQLASIDIDIDFHSDRLWGNMFELAGWFHTIGDSV